MLAMAPTQQKRAPILGTKYQLVFHTCEGLRDGDPVVVGGVDAGRVVNIDFAPESDWTRLNLNRDKRPVVLVTVALNPGFSLSEGTGYKVVSTLRGNHFINILPPTPGQVLSAGAVLNQELPPETEDQLNATLRNFKELSRQTEDFRDQFSDPQSQREIKDLASNMRFYSAEFVRVSREGRQRAQQLDAQLAEQEEQIVSQLQRMDAQASRAAGYLHTYVPQAREEMHRYRQRLAEGQKQLDQMVALGQHYGDQLQQYVQTLENSPLTRLDPEKLADRIHKIKNQLDDYANIAGDMHTLASDPGVQKDFKGYFKRFKNQSEKLKARVHSLEQQADKYRWMIPEEHK